MRRSSARAVLTAAAPLVVFCLFAAGCGTRKAPATTPQPPGPVTAAPAQATAPRPSGAGGSVPGAHSLAPAPLVGHVTRKALENYETWKTLRADDYTPDPAAVRTIASHWRGVRVLVILGTWCKDSKRDLPRFFKIADLAKIRLDSVTLVAVDRSKKDAEGLAEANKIERVPTFVFFRGKREVGRVIEKPVTTLENDMAAILSK